MDVPVSSRLAAADYVEPPDSTAYPVELAAKLDHLDANVSDTAAAAELAAIPQAVWDVLTTALATPGSIGAYVMTKLGLITAMPVTVTAVVGDGLSGVEQNIIMRQAETRTVAVTVLDARGDPIDLAGYEVEYRAETPTPIIKSVANGLITLGDPGVFMFTIEPEDTDDIAISEGTYRYDHEARIRSAGGEEYSVLTVNLLLTKALFTLVP